MARQSIVRYLRGIFTPNQAFRSEWQHIKKNRLLIVSVVVMLFIPIMYGGFFLGSIWDPYGNTQNLPIAVVNKDTGATMDNKTIEVGAGLVDTLKDEHSMGWKFVNEETADKGLADGTYYMKIVIPEDASRNVTSVTSEMPSKTIIAYTTTPSRNFVASLLTKEAAETIAQNVSSEITNAYSKTILEQIDELKDGIGDAADGAVQLRDGSLQLQQGIADYTKGVAEVNSGVETLSNGLPTQAQIEELSSGIQSLRSGINALNTAIGTPDPKIVAKQAVVQEDAAALQVALVSYQTSASGAQASMAALGTAISGGSSTVTVNTSDIAATIAVVQTSRVVAQKSILLLTDLNALTTALNEQQTELKSSVSQLNAGVNIIAPSAISAIKGYTTLTSGSSRLLAGTASLAASSEALLDGATQLGEGSTTLATGLIDTAQQLALQQTDSATAEQISQPVETEHYEVSDVPNYGYALSPYVLSLGLYVGAFVFNVIYPVRRLYGIPKNARSWWRAKMSVAFVVAVGQALVLDAIMVLGLGLHPDQPAQFMLLSIITSVTYMSIISLLAITLDNIGRFLAMLLLVMQLGAAGGVFPIILSSSFFQAINPFMPMTYSIYGFREAVSSGLGSSVFWSNLWILVAIAIATNLVLIVALRLHGMHHFKHESVDA